MTTTIQPAMGNGALFTQQGVGTTPGYDAIDDRRVLWGGAQEGVVDSGAFAVTQRAAGANLSVDIATDDGFAKVQGDSLTWQGIYTVAPHASSINEAVTANATGNPRIDQVILEVLDNLHDASGANLARVRILAGTATVGATLDNRLGVAALPGTALLLADLLVTAGASSVSTAQIRDRRKHAHGVMHSYTRSATDLTTTSTSYGDIDATNWKVRGEFSGGPVVVEFAGTLKRGVNDAELTIGLAVDGGTEMDRLVFLGSGISGEGRTLTWRPVLAAGSHLLAARWKVPGGTGTVDAASRPSWSVEEKRTNASNGSS